MKIIGLNLSGISAKRKDKLEDQLEIKQNIDLGEIISIKASSNKELAKLNFTSSVNYSDSAEFEIKGHLILSPEAEELKEILNLQKDKKLSPELKISLINFIMAHCNLKLLELENELGLPFHIPFPKIAPKKE